LFREYLLTAAEIDCDVIKHVILPAPGGQTTVWVDKQELTDLGEKLSDMNTAKEKIQEAYKSCDDLVNTCKNISELDLTTQTNEGLLEQYRAFVRTQYFHGFTMIYPHAIEQFLVKLVENKLGEILKSQGKENEKIKYEEALFTSSKETFATTEQKEMMEIVKLAKQGTDVKEKLKQHSKKYSWLPVYNPDEPVFDEEHFQKEFEEMKATEVNFQENNFEAILQELNPDKEFVELLNLLREYIYLRTYRTDVMKQAYTFIKPLIAQIAKRANLTNTELLHLIPNEVEAFLEKGELPEKNEITQRVKHFAIWSEKPEIEIFSDETEIEKIREKAFPEKEIEKEVQGRTACPGKVTGRVKLVFGIEDIQKIHQGDIIVSPMTAPDLTVG